MKPKQKLKIAIDIGMTALLFCQMAYMLISGAALSRIRIWVLRGLALLFSGFGVYAFLKHNIADYLFLRSQFVFFDMEQPLAMFFVEYLAMMCLWACIAYYGGRML